MSISDYKNYRKIPKLFNPYENIWFPIFISLINALAYLFIVLMVTYVDKNYENVIYGVREYPWGTSVGLISIPVFIITFISAKFIKSPTTKVFTIFVSSLIILVILSITNFNIGRQGQVEIPNMALAAFLVLSETAISVITYMHYRAIDFNYLGKISISESAREERLKFEYSTYSKVLITIIAAFLGGFYTMYCNLFNVLKNFTQDIEATTLIFNNMLLAMFVFSILIIILTIQVIVIVFFMAKHLTDIKTKPDKSG